MFGAIAVLALGTAVIRSPWIIRNYIMVHSFVPTATIAGLAAQAGLYTCENMSRGEPFFVADGEAGLERKEIARQLGIPSIGPYFQLFYTPQDELTFYRALLNRVSTEYRNHPEVLAGCAAKNFFFNFWFLGKTPKSVLFGAVIATNLEEAVALEKQLTQLPTVASVESTVAPLAVRMCRVAVICLPSADSVAVAAPTSLPFSRVVELI